MRLLFLIALPFSINFLEAKSSSVTYEKEMSIELLNSSPKILYIHNFLSEKECDHLISLARSELSRSTVVDNSSTGNKVDNSRTSRGMFLTKYPNDPIIKKIEKRISSLTKIPQENGETIQVLDYKKGQEYKPHHDYFEADNVGGAACLKRGGQRVATFIMYLNTPEEGGETLFPLLYLNVKPIKRNALLFYNSSLEGDVDPFTLHGGAPVIKGEKWIATKWLRQHIFK